MFYRTLGTFLLDAVWQERYLYERRLRWQFPTFRHRLSRVRWQLPHMHPSPTQGQALKRLCASFSLRSGLKIPRAARCAKESVSLHEKRSMRRPLDDSSGDLTGIFRPLLRCASVVVSIDWRLREHLEPLCRTFASLLLAIWQAPRLLSGRNAPTKLKKTRGGKTWTPRPQLSVVLQAHYQTAVPLMGQSQSSGLGITELQFLLKGWLRCGR